MKSKGANFGLRRTLKHVLVVLSNVSRFGKGQLSHVIAVLKQGQ
jgi:hypothetical protein